MKIYNSLTLRKEEFIPLHEGKISMYVCGPTVYNLIHIGNARPMIVFDTFRRYLMHKGYEVNYVSNFTDVDDKIIKAANEEGVSSEEIAERYIAECRKDMDAMNVLPATVHPRATEEIDGMIEMIEKLIEDGHAYEKAGTVYFSTRSYSKYGELSHKNLDDLRSGFRELKVSGEEEKEDPLDFVLWKPKKEGEPSWPSPWGSGRPGWHIECSVMAKRYLGETIDIHAGGEDLVFPHHENEIAQSVCANEVPFARYWMHNAFLNIDNRKMSKSLGNFFTVRDIAKKYDLQVLRFFMLSAHYRSPLNFSAPLMESAAASLERITNCAGRLKDLEASCANPMIGEKDREILKNARDFVIRFDEKMDDDCNTADAISVIFDLVKYANINITEETGAAAASDVLEILLSLTDILGLVVLKEEGDVDEEVEELIAQRTRARKEKNYAEADRIRDELKNMGIELLDTKEGVKWKRI